MYLNIFHCIAVMENIAQLCLDYQFIFITYSFRINEGIYFIVASRKFRNMKCSRSDFMPILGLLRASSKSNVPHPHKFTIFS